MIRDILRTTQYALQQVWRNLWLSVVTMFLLFLTMFSMTMVVGLNIVGQNMIQAVQQKVDVDFYFYEYVPEKDILAVQEYLQKLSSTQSVRYTSKDDALKQFTQRHKDDPAVLASLSELDSNVLPASLTVKASALDQYDDLIAAIERSEYAELIDRTDYTDNSVLIGRIERLTDIANQSAILISGVFLVIAVVVIFNTFRITIYSYREEIGIMKLVGATNGFIRLPFIMEGIILGAFAALATVLVSVAVLWLTDDAIRSFFTGYSFSLLSYTQAHWWLFLFSEFAIAMSLSVVFTMIAITRYLKV